MRKRRNSLITGVVFGALTLAACGAGSDGASSPTIADAPVSDTLVVEPTEPADEFSEAQAEAEPADEEPPSASAVPADTATADSTEVTEPSTDSETDPAEAAEGSTEPTPDAQPDPVEPDPAETEPDPTEPAPVQAPVTKPPQVSTPAEPAVGGRSLAADVQPAARFDANPFPDLVVEDVGKGTQVNVANILPSDRPVLLWAWAPH